MIPQESEYYEQQIKRLCAEIIQLRADRDQLIKVLTVLTDSVDSWEVSVVSVIGRHPQTGMSTEPARALLTQLAGDQR